MLGFAAAAALHPAAAIPLTSKFLPILPLIPNRRQTSSTLDFYHGRRNPRKFATCAENGNGLGTDPKDQREKTGDEAFKNSNSNHTSGGGGGGEDVKKNGRRPTFNPRWVDLLLEPDPDNVVAVGLTGLLAWASVQVLWQLFFISLAILVAALKYSFVAALLLFILVTLL